MSALSTQWLHLLHEVRATPARGAPSLTLPVVRPRPHAPLADECSFNPVASPLGRSEGQSGARGAQPYLGARTRIVRRQDDRWGVIPAGSCLRPLGSRRMWWARRQSLRATERQARLWSIRPA